MNGMGGVGGGSTGSLESSLASGEQEFLLTLQFLFGETRLLHPAHFAFAVLLLDLVFAEYVLDLVDKVLEAKVLEGLDDVFGGNGLFRVLLAYLVGF